MSSGRVSRKSAPPRSFRLPLNVLPLLPQLRNKRLELRRRSQTRQVRVFPNVASGLRLVRARAVEMHENWIEATRYLNMEDLKEHKKEQLRRAAA